MGTTGQDFIGGSVSQNQMMARKEIFRRLNCTDVQDNLFFLERCTFLEGRGWFEIRVSC
jgi:hypothetical protein